MNPLSRSSVSVCPITADISRVAVADPPAFDQMPHAGLPVVPAAAAAALPALLPVKEPAVPVVATVQPSPAGVPPVDAVIENALAELRGEGAAAKQSAELLSVSTTPLPLRKTAVVLDGAADAVVSAQFAVLPKPILSTRIAASVEQALLLPV